MKIANVKGMVAKVLSVGLLAGAVAMVAPAKAEAQQVSLGGYYPGYYARHDFYDRGRIEAYRRHEAFVREREGWRFRHDRFYRGYR